MNALSVITFNMHCIYSINTSLISPTIICLFSVFFILKDKLKKKPYIIISKMFTELAEEPIPIQKKNKGGRPLNGIWEDINKGNPVGSGKFSASCKYCDTEWR